MILKDLEAVDKPVKKDPEENTTVSSPPLRIPTQQNSVSPSQHMAEQRPIQSRLEQSPYVPPSGVSNLHNANGDLTTLNTMGGMQAVAGANIIRSFNPTAVSLAASLAAAASTRPLNTAKTELGAPLCSGSVGGILPISSDVLGVKASVANAQQFAPGNQPVTTDWQSNMLSTGYNSSPSPIGMATGSRVRSDADDSSQKRQVRLLKNREAAKECRRKKKEYVKCLENRVSVLETQNKALIEELKTLKELYCRKEKTEL
uniref:BZIP domain-containing protein n=1 Tax=Syphacia muris TaxID=451379 RepID=A0A0N5AY97_9BILA